MDDELMPSGTAGTVPMASPKSSESLPKRCISFMSMVALCEMRLSETLCDASIVYPNEGHEFPVHRVIMSSCSDYFRTLFTTSLPSDKQTVTVSSVEPLVMAEVIRYVYCRECNLTERSVYDVFAAADFLLIRSLTEYCGRFLVDHLRLDNCVAIMQFGKQRSSRQLYDAARMYVLKQFPVLIGSNADTLLQLSGEDLCTVLASDQLNVSDEAIVWEFAVRWIDQDPGVRARHLVPLMKTVRLGLLSTEYFSEKVKQNPYVVATEEAKPLIIDALTYLYDLEMISTKAIREMKTPAIGLPRLPHEVIFTVGGWSEGMPQAIIETYDTRSDRWTRIPTEDPAGPRAYYGAAYIGTQLYLVGGFDGVEHFHTCRRFDMVEKVWHEIAPMHFRRCYVSVVALDGLLYAMGGYDGSNRHNTVERYNPRTNQWTLIAPMAAIRSDADACVLGGHIYITGGFNGSECLNTAESYDPAANLWSPLPPMHSRRSGVSCMALDGVVYAVGGFNGLVRLVTCERYEPATRAWVVCANMCYPRSNFGLETIDGRLCAIGGYDGAGGVAYVECYEPETDEWCEATNLSMLRSAFRAVTVADLPNVADYLHADKENLFNELYHNRQLSEVMESDSTSSIEDID
ncbi:kelch-like protein 10 [Anopheles cruzii]|uniref:kelch-like protein 10 n=1 Tax=Anopheles cruzii TaxID=68878 RepID=UPI0022EC2B05|nr:kelch-like protein 10 [Anopheles cruzii]